MVKKKKRSGGKALKKATKKIIAPIKKEKRIRRDLFFIILYTIILLLVLIFVSPRIKEALDMGFENSLIVTFLGVSIIFFSYYYITKKRDWKKVHAPPKWVVKKRKSLGDDFSGQIIVEGKTYRYLITKHADKTTYYAKEKDKE